MHLSVFTGLQWAYFGDRDAWVMTGGRPGMPVMTVRMGKRVEERAFWKIWAWVPQRRPWLEELISYHTGPLFPGVTGYGQGGQVGQVGQGDLDRRIEIWISDREEGVGSGRWASDRDFWVFWFAQSTGVRMPLHSTLPCSKLE